MPPAYLPAIHTALIESRGVKATPTLWFKKPAFVVVIIY